MPTERTSSNAPPEPTADAWAWHSRLPRCWWGEPLPTQRRDPQGQVVGLSDVGWWSQPRLAALILWAGNGMVRDLARAIAGTSADRMAYAMRRGRARWVADRLGGRSPEDPIEAASAILSQPLPSDRIRHAERGAARLEQVAAMLPPPPPACGDLAAYALASLRVVEACDGLWPSRCDPRRQVLGNDAHEGPTMGTIIPETRKPIDHDARMLAADGIF